MAAESHCPCPKLFDPVPGQCQTVTLLAAADQAQALFVPPKQRKKTKFMTEKEQLQLLLFDSPYNGSTILKLDSPYNGYTIFKLRSMSMKTVYLSLFLNRLLSFFLLVVLTIAFRLSLFKSLLLKNFFVVLIWIFVGLHLQCQQ